MKQLFVLITAAMIAVSLPAESATVKKSTKPAVTKKVTKIKKKPPVSNVRPEIKQPKKVERKATLTKKKSKR